MIATLFVGAANAVFWIGYALNPTVGSAIIAALASVFNTWLLMRHEKKVDRRFDERRNVIVKGSHEDPEAVFISGEERRELEDRRALKAQKELQAQKEQERRKQPRRGKGTR